MLRCLVLGNALTACLCATAEVDEGRHIWKHFREIMKIPRCSGEEEGMRRYIRQLAKAHNCDVHQDRVGNLILKRAGLGAPVIIQTHVDMVCEKHGESAHDWKRDPVQAVERDGWLIAENTTLGADNGIGVATALALLEEPRTTTFPPLELVFTVQEETGLDGAFGLDTSRLSGRRLVNLDTEEWGIVYIGSAGGGNVRITLPVESAPLATNSIPRRMVLKGLQGGHSGVDIHEDRGNALLLLSRAVAEFLEAIPGTRLLHLEGGNLDNAIPRDSTAWLSVEPGQLSRARAVVETIERDLTKEYGRLEPNLALFLAEEAGNLPLETPPLSGDSASRLLDLLMGLPYGVLKRSHEVDGLVETSNNVARVVRAEPGAVEILCLARSSIGAALEHVHRRIHRLAQRCGARTARGATFPGWAPNASQALLALTADTFKELEGRRPQMAAIHAGLECGIIGSNMPGLEMVSFGPDIRGAHAPGERVRTESVARLAVMLRRVLEKLAQTQGATNNQREL